MASVEEAGEGLVGRIERDGPVTTVILHRPHARNAVDGPTARALADAFRAFDTDDGASVALGPNGELPAEARIISDDGLVHTVQDHS